MKLYAIFSRRGPRQLPHWPHPIFTTDFGTTPVLRPQVTLAPGHKKKFLRNTNGMVTKLE